MKENNLQKQQRSYDKEYVEQALKLAEKIGVKEAAKELGIPMGTISYWKNNVGNSPKRGRKKGSQGEDEWKQEALRLRAQVKELQDQVAQDAKQQAEDKETIDVLEAAVSFFAAGRKKS